MKKHLVLLALLWLPAMAYGQVELIVRVEESADAALARALEARADSQTAGAQQQLRLADSTQTMLFEGVRRTRAVLQAKGGAAPIRAYVLSVSDSAAFDALRRRWSGRDGVRYVQPNHTYRIDRAAADGFPNDPLLDSLSHLSVIRARTAWRVTTGHPDVHVGLIDTGVFLEHPDFQGQFGVNPPEDLNGNGRFDNAPAEAGGDLDGQDNDGNGYADDVIGYDFVDRPDEIAAGDFVGPDPDPSADLETGHPHGTLVAGLLSAAIDNGEGIAGVAPGARLRPLRAFGGDGRGQDDDIAAAIVYAADESFDVINLSFGDIYYSPLMEEAIRYATSQGVVVVASAGNSANNEPHYPSDYEDAISVAWLNAEGVRGAVSFATFGPGIDLGAPGSGIFTTLLPPPDEEWETDDLYGFLGGGSSYAAPMVSGAAALLRSLDPSLSPASIRSILTTSAVDIEEEGWDQRTGAGRLDIASALAQTLPGHAEITLPGNDGGSAEEEVAVIGTAIHPSFASYSLYYATGYDEPEWTRIAGPVERQVYQDTLAVWDTKNLPDTTYTLRLALELRTGGTVEKQHRFFLDRTPPEITIHLLDAGLVGAHQGILADVETSDLTDVVMHITLDGRTYTARSDRRARRHGLTWTDERGTGGTAQVVVEAVNAAGLSATHTAEVAVPPDRFRPSLFAEEVLDVPYGYLLPEATDFDADGLLEIIFNRLERSGGLGDTLAVYEWSGESFASAHRLIANVIPRDVGDTNSNGRPELLTSITSATLLLEPSAPETYPDAEVFRSQSVSAALLDDLDGDGRGEIIAHADSTQWLLLEHHGEGYQEIARLDNPTSTQNTEETPNLFTRLEALTGDFDGDGRRELLTGDLDGDWILYESTGDNAFEVAWTYETPRYNAGARFAKGDFDGDGLDEFVTYTDPLKQNVREREGQRFEQEPPFGRYYFWDNTGDNAYRLVKALPVAGTVSTEGSMTAADFDGDGHEELALVHPPHLYLFDYSEGAGWQAVYQRGPAAGEGLRSHALTAADFDGDRAPELIAGAADGRFRRFVYQHQRAGAPPAPRWTQAVALDSSRVALAWRAPGADSVTVYQGAPDGGAFERLAARTDSSLVVETTARRRYRLRAWYDEGAGSPLSEERVIAPYAPAVVAAISYPEARRVKLVFTRVLSTSVHADQFVLEPGIAPASLLLAEGGRAVVLRFERLPAGRTGTLRWRGIRDAEGTPVAQTSAAVAFPEPSGGTLIVANWVLSDERTVALTFAEALDPAFAEDERNYRIEPSGHVAEAQHDAENPARVVVHIAGTQIGATGREQALTVVQMRSASGATLAPEGWAVALSRPAEDLENVYVYPNPHHAGRHDGPVRVAGLPIGATVQVFSIEGTLVAEMGSEDTGRNGGVTWDLTDRRGARVPAGVYLVRVEAPDASPVLKKVAVIR